LQALFLKLGWPQVESIPAQAQSVRTKTERRGMGRLVEPDLAAAGQLDGCPDPPRRFFNFGAADSFIAQGLDSGLQVVAHQIQHRAQQGVPGVYLQEVSRVDREFRGRQRKDQPASTHIHGAELQHIAEEGAVGFGIFAVEKNVGAVNHRTKDDYAVPRATDAALLKSS